MPIVPVKASFTARLILFNQILKTLKSMLIAKALKAVLAIGRLLAVVLENQLYTLSGKLGYAPKIQQALGRVHQGQ